MIQFKTTISLEKNVNTPIYVQISNQIIQLIKRGILLPNSKLPGTRRMGEILNVHRKTAIAAYDELMSQGWIEVIPSKGTYISGALPLTQKQSLKSDDCLEPEKEKAGFSYIKRKHLDYKEVNLKQDVLKINDGLPDSRLSPIKEIATKYRNILKDKQGQNLKYDSIYGNLELRKALTSYLNETRGLSIDVEQILITRGSQMGIYLTSQLIVSNKGEIIVGHTNYKSADDTFFEASGTLNVVAVDQNGLVTTEIEKLCKKRSIAAVYVTSHHHHPTTVALSAERRMHLLALANQYKFAIIEDDYAYDFHYSNAPIMPLASYDLHGNVIYIGSFSKTIAPAIRVGYLIAPKDFVKEAAQYRKIIDRQGDSLLELTMASMIKDGNLQRHSKKVIKIYKSRRDLFCKLLKEKLGNYFNFKVPDGGLAVWVKLDKKYNWENIRIEALKQGLSLTSSKRYDVHNIRHNGIRMGFSSLNEEEIVLSIEILEKVINKMKKLS